MFRRHTQYFFNRTLRTRHAIAARLKTSQVNQMKLAVIPSHISQQHPRMRPHDDRRSPARRSDLRPDKRIEIIPRPLPKSEVWRPVTALAPRVDTRQTPLAAGHTPHYLQGIRY
jgi:hypothetical protein